MKSRFALVLEALEAGVVIHAPDTSVVDANARARELLGIQDIEGRVATDPAWVFMDESRRILAVAEYPVVEAIRTGSPKRGQTILVRRPDGRIIWVEANALPRFDDSGDLLDVAVTFIDVSEREERRVEAERLNEELRQLAVTDSLTGLTNRRGIFGEAERLREAAVRLKQSLVFLMLDLDGFKDVNDQQGHLAGDHVLNDVARSVESHLRDQDLVGRIGGDELLILLPGADEAGGCALAERIRAGIGDTAQSGAGASVTCSIGLARAEPRESVAEIILRADRALYRAKAAGGDCVMVSECPGLPATSSP